MSQSRLKAFESRLLQSATNIGASLSLRTEGTPHVHATTILVQGTADILKQEHLNANFITKPDMELELLREIDIPDDNAIVEALAQLATQVHNELQDNNAVIRVYCILLIKDERKIFEAVVAHSEARGTFVLRKGESKASLSHVLMLSF